jgi:transcriptional regulator with PAS, ATPase and Fis domain
MLPCFPLPHPGATTVNLPPVAVLARTDSFQQVWATLADQVGASVRVAGSLAELAPLGGACALLLSLAGEEEAAAERIAEVRAAGASAVAVVGAATDHRVAIAAMEAGAANYFALPHDLEALREWLRDRVERAGRSEQQAARATFERARYDFSRIVGESPGILEALDRTARLIPRDSVTVLITGETGTGKELFAQAIHHNGPRRSAPLVEVNCAALPETLLEAELFGYEKGAFTDARAAKPGLFEAAHRGTLFLDEIGELSPALQAKLLKVLDDGQLRRLGSVRSIQVDVRIIAATHADLATMVREGTFRRDLFYRLDVLRIALPPLRERGHDVVLLAELFLDRFSHAYAVARPAITPDVRQALLAHPWPGNIRELRNGLERAVLLGDGALRPEHLFSATEPARRAGGEIPFPATMDEIEQAAARAMVERFEGNKTAAADALAISRTRLYRLLGADDA